MASKLKNEQLNRLSPEEFRESVKCPLIAILDNVRSLHNIGSVFRSADAFRLESIYLCGLSGVPPNKEIEKTALGATETVHWEYFQRTEDALHAARKKGFTVYSVEQAEKSIPLDLFAPGAEKVAVVFGNEVYGVEQNILDLSDGVIEIPQSGSKHSLNVSVAAGVVFWEISRKVKFAQKDI